MFDLSHLPSRIDPVFMEIGPVAIRYYGLCFLASILVTYSLISRNSKFRELVKTPDLKENLLFYALIGICLGGRLGYVVFYQFEYFVTHPLEIFLPLSFDRGIQWVGISGMSYHGGFIGFLAALIIFCRQYKLSILRLGDILAYYIPIGYFFGRVGNFLNGELWGRMTHVPWGMIFPEDTLQLKRHPSQLYEALGEGILLFFFLKILKDAKHWHDGAMSAFYIMGYGMIRFFLEYFREPDAHLGYLLQLTMGQWLCLVMVAAGGVFFFISQRRS